MQSSTDVTTVGELFKEEEKGAVGALREVAGTAGPAAETEQPVIKPEIVIEDGLEIRTVAMRLRKNGIKEILNGLSKYGFCSSGVARIVEDGQFIIFEFVFNTGRYDTRIKALPIQIRIQMTDKEKEYVPEESPEDQVTTEI